MLKTKILCTMGPACDSVAILKEMISSGMNIARLIMAHGEPEEHIERISSIRRAASEQNAFVPILMDIKGPEIRIGKLKEPFVQLVNNKEIILTTEQIEGDSTRVPISYADLPKVVQPGCRVLIDDGLIELTVTSSDEHNVHCRIVSGGVLKPRKGVNLPGVKTTLPGVTEKDIRHIQFGVENGIEIIAVSFVRKAEDIVEVRNRLASLNAEHVQIISKIENEEGVANADAIIAVSDGIMVARGDLGVEIPIEEIPLIQRELIHKCNTVGKPVIVATHMLESMQANPRPTRAEVSDVTAAVLQGADVIMLSGESAVGKYPVQAVSTMSKIARKVESTLDYAEQFAVRRANQATGVTEIISQAVVSTSLDLNAKAIIAPTESGFTARMVSKYRPKAPIIAITPHPHLIPKLTLLRGVIPMISEEIDTTDAMFKSAIDYSSQLDLLEKNDYVVISAGVPLGKSGSTNLIKIEQI